MEYHAAACIKGLPEPNAIKFYAMVRADEWSEWEEVLQFLSRIDTYRYLKHVVVTSLRAFVECPTLETLLEGTVTVVKTAKGHKLELQRGSWLLNHVEVRARRLLDAVLKPLLQDIALLPGSCRREFDSKGQVLLSRKALVELSQGKLFDAPLAAAAATLQMWLAEAQSEVRSLTTADTLLDF